MAAPQSKPLQSTTDLLKLAREGHEPARRELFSRFLPALKAWAHGRLPPDARGMLDTDDLVTETLLRALKHLDTFESRHEGAYFAYLRTILRNQIRDELRRVRCHPRREDLSDDLPDGLPSPLDHVIAAEALERYDQASSALSHDQQAGIFLRIECGLSYSAIADALGRPSANAARLLVSRALVQLAEKMRER